MSNYKTMSREDEARLVPSRTWATIHPNGVWEIPGGSLFVDPRGCLSVLSVNDAQMDQLIPALQFFAATGRLPRRLDAEGEGV